MVLRQRPVLNSVLPISMLGPPAAVPQRCVGELHRPVEHHTHAATLGGQPKCLLECQCVNRQHACCHIPLCATCPTCRDCSSENSIPTAEPVALPPYPPCPQSGVPARLARLHLRQHRVTRSRPSEHHRHTRSIGQRPPVWQLDHQPRIDHRLTPRISTDPSPDHSIKQTGHAWTDFVTTLPLRSPTRGTGIYSQRQLTHPKLTPKARTLFELCPGANSFAGMMPTSNLIGCLCCRRPTASPSWYRATAGSAVVEASQPGGIGCAVPDHHCSHHSQ